MRVEIGAAGEVADGDGGFRRGLQEYRRGDPLSRAVVRFPLHRERVAEKIGVPIGNHLISFAIFLAVAGKGGLLVYTKQQERAQKSAVQRKQHGDAEDKPLPEIIPTFAFTHKRFCFSSVFYTQRHYSRDDKSSQYFMVKKCNR